MESERKLDALVGEKVMGRDMTKPEGFKYPIGLPHYSTDIAAAWKVVEHLKRLEPQLSFHPVSGMWMCIFNGDEGSEYEDYDSHGESAPLCICLAALAATGHSVIPSAGK